MPEPVDNASPNGSLAAIVPSSAVSSLEKAAGSSPAETVTTQPGSGTAQVTGDTAKPADNGNVGATAEAGKPAATSKPGQPVTASPTANRGEAPPSRIEAAVRNARNAATAEVEQKYAWAKNLDAESVSSAVSVARRLIQDPRAFWQELGKEIGSTESAREEDLTEPEPDLVSDDGRYKTYSDKTLNKMWEIREKRLVQRLMGEMKPMKDFLDETRESRNVTEVTQAAQKLASEALTQARGLPHFKEHEAAILVKLRGMDPAVRQRIGPIAAMYASYAEVLKTVVLPGVDTAAEARVREDNQRKAATAGSVVPSGSRGESRTPALRNQSDLARHMETLAAAQSR